MTGNYLIIIPIMLSSIIGTVVAAKLNNDTIDTVDSRGRDRQGCSSVVTWLPYITVRS